jgi:hypothetical protein
MSKHKWSTVLIAMAEGKDVQYCKGEGFQWEDPKDEDINPISRPKLIWRVKPDIIEDSYNDFIEKDYAHDIPNRK